VLLLCVPYIVGAADAPPAPAPNASVIPGASGKPAWLDYLEGASKIATIAGIVLGGIAAYYKFLRGRVFHARMDIAMSSSFLRIREEPFLQVQAQVKNTGASRIRFVLQDSILTVFGANHAHRAIADDSEWEIVATVDGISKGKHKWIEPAETIYLNWLIDLPRDLAYAALKSELLLSARKIVWQADTIATTQLADQRVRAEASSRDRSSGSSVSGGLRQLWASLRCLMTTGERK
jgi:hypothetical protein